MAVADRLAAVVQLVVGLGVAGVDAVRQRVAYEQALDALPARDALELAARVAACRRKITRLKLIHNPSVISLFTAAAVNQRVLERRPHELEAGVAVLTSPVPPDRQQIMPRNYMNTVYF